MKRQLATLLSPYLALTKARLTLLVTATAGVGYLLADSQPVASWQFVLTLIGTALAATGSMALNQWWETELDARMERTKDRPVPSGAITRPHALVVGLGLAATGVALLAWRVNVLTAAIALLVVLLYVLVYTPLKIRTPLATLVGAVCGALPPVMGWSAARGSIDPPALLLAALLFLWQIPHFLSLAWLYRDEYARAGFKMLPLYDADGRLTAWITVLYTSALVPVAAVAAAGGLAGSIYALGTLVLGLCLVVVTLGLARERSAAAARRVFLATLAYLPLVLALLVADRRPDASLDGATAAAGHAEPGMHASVARPRAVRR